MMLLSIFAKFGKFLASFLYPLVHRFILNSFVLLLPSLFPGVLLATMPHAMASGLYCIVFAMIVSVGLSNLKHIDLDNQRNLFILGFSIFNSLSVAGPGGYFGTVEGNPFGTSNGAAIALSLFSSPMIIAFMTSIILDNTANGATREERGLTVWEKASEADINNDPEYIRVYSLPLFFAKIFRNCSYLEYTSRGKLPDPPANGKYQASKGDVGELCCPCFEGNDSDENDENNDADVESNNSPPGSNVIVRTYESIDHQVDSA